MVYLVLHLCLSGNLEECYDHTLKLYQNKTYCDKMGIIEAARVASSFPPGYVIMNWKCR